MDDISILNAETAAKLFRMAAELRKVDRANRALPHDAQVAIARSADELERAAISIAKHRSEIDDSGPCRPLARPLKH